MASYTFAQLEQLWTQQGGSQAWAPVAAGIALAESGGNPAAVDNTAYPNLAGYHPVAPGNSPEYSVGLYQVNLVAHPNYTAAQMTDPAQATKAAVALSANGGNWQPWVSDPVGNAAISSPTQPLSMAQVTAILKKAGRSTGGAATSTGTVAPQAATLTAATSSGSSGLIPSSPPPVPDQSANPLTDIGRDTVWFGQFAAWTIFTALIFVFGLILLLLGGIMLGVVLLGPVVSPAAGLIPGPVGRLARSGKGSSVGAPARTIAAASGGRTRSRGSNQLFEQRRSLQEQRHEHRMTEIETRGSVRRSNMGRPRSDPSYDDGPF